jgi:hypothetical protein
MTDYEPYNQDAEKAMLCAMLQEPECINDAISIAGPAEFSKAHSLIYSEIFAIHQAGGIPDLITVTNSLKQNGKLEEAGGPAYISELPIMGAIARNIKAYAEIVAKSADSRRAREAIKVALKKASSNGGDPDNALQIVIEELQSIQKPKTAINWKIYDAGNISEWPQQPLEWHAEPLIPKHSVGFMSAPPKDRKSLLTLDLALHLAQPEPRLWLGKFKVMPAKVLYIAREDPIRRVRERALEICQSYQMPLPEPGRLQFVIQDRIHLTELEHRAWLIRAIQAGGFDILILDVINRMHPDLDEISAKDMGRLVSILEELNRDLGITILADDHTRKPQGKNTARDNQEPNPFDLKGSIAKYGCADFMICLARTPQDNRMQVYIENRDTDERPHFFVDVSPKGSTDPKFTYAGDVTKLAGDMKIVGEQNREKVFEVFAESKEWMKPKDVGLQLSMARQTVTKHIKTLFDAGRLEQHGKGPSTEYRIVIDYGESTPESIKDNLFKDND